MRPFLLALLLVLPLAASARDLAGATVYLPNETHDAQAAIAMNAPKRMVMHFVYSKLSNEQLVDAFADGFARNAPQAVGTKEVETFLGWVPAEARAGDELVFDYVPGTGTTVTFRGQVLGTIEGEAFMRALFAQFLGPKPPTAAFKRGLVG